MADYFSVPDYPGPLRASDIRAVETAQAAHRQSVYLRIAEISFAIICVVLLAVYLGRALRRLPRAASVNMPDPPIGPRGAAQGPEPIRQ
jgi:hypothetical protein